jgi:hypothetical protein
MGDKQKGAMEKNVYYKLLSIFLTKHLICIIHKASHSYVHWHYSSIIKLNLLPMYRTYFEDTKKCLYFRKLHFWGEYMQFKNLCTYSFS